MDKEKMLNKLKEDLNNMTNEEFEKHLQNAGIEYTKVEPGKGGVFINGINIKELDEENQFIEDTIYYGAKYTNDSEIDIHKF